MNKPVDKKYEEWMSEDDIAIYDQLVSMGRLQLGKELAANEEFMLDIAAMITLKQMKGMLVSIDDPAIAELKRIHAEHQAIGLIHTTPADTWYESARVLREPYLSPEVEAEIDYANALVGVDTALSHTSNLIVKSCEADKNNTSNIATGNDVIDDMLVVEGVARVIEKDWVKLVPPEAPV
jgi:cAMP phosphodiesterase